MTQPHLALFQAAATAIPALLIAVAVTIGRGKALAEDYAKQGRYERTFRLASVILIGALAANAEINALLATARGSGTREQAFWVVLGATLLLINVIFELIYPLIYAESEEWVQMAVKAVLLVLVLGALYTIGQEFLPFTGML